MLLYGFQKFCGVAANPSDCNLNVNKCILFYLRVHVMCLNEPVCAEKLKGQIINSDLLLQTLYLCLDNKIFLNKIHVCAVIHICLESEIQLKQKFAFMVQIVSH
jgi:hypothetical protein